MRFERPETFGQRPLATLDFDIEARPLGWLGGDFVHMEITAIASAWVVDGKPKDMQVETLTKRDGSAQTMLRGFLKRAS